LSDTTATADQARLAATRRSQARKNLLLSLTLLGLLLLLWLALALSTRMFLSEINVTNLMRQAYLVAILAVGQTFVIITAGIDLSVGAVIGFCSVILALLLKAEVSIPLAILLTLAMGAAIGVFHGFGIVQLGLPPFIMTLATLTALRGMGFLITNGSTISGLPDAFTAFAPSSFLGIPSLFWMVIVVAIPSYVFLHHSRWGRYLFAIGSNPEAARLSGVNVPRMIYVAYILSAFLAAVAAVLATSRLSIGTQNTGQGLELQAIAATVIGGTSLFGAVGSVYGPLLGSFLLTTIANGANLLNVNPFWQLIITGALIIVIVYFDQLRRRRKQDGPARGRPSQSHAKPSISPPVTSATGAVPSANQLPRKSRKLLTVAGIKVRCGQRACRGRDRSCQSAKTGTSRPAARLSATTNDGARRMPRPFSASSRRKFTSEARIRPSMATLSLVPARPVNDQRVGVCVCV